MALPHTLGLLGWDQNPGPDPQSLGNTCLAEGLTLSHVSQLLELKAVETIM